VLNPKSKRLFTHYVSYTNPPETLYLFGSVLTERFDSQSDVDFLVNFKEVDLMSYFDNYIDFKHELKNLLKRNVGFVEEKAIRNPILKQSIERTKQLIYGL